MESKGIYGSQGLAHGGGVEHVAAARASPERGNAAMVVRGPHVGEPSVVHTAGPAVDRWTRADRRQQRDRRRVDLFASRRRDVSLSILMPAYNEQRTVADAITAVLSQQYPCEIELIVINDGSTDATADILRAVRHPRARVITHEVNLGKGAALQTGAAVASGTHLVPFDADLEYDPRDLPAMLQPVIEGRADVVYGTRLLGTNTRYLSFTHALGNRVMTLAASLIFDVYLSDLHSCLKLIPVESFRGFDFKEHGFGLDTEVTAKLLATGVKPFEVPISYHSRTASHGKKITWRDGVTCLRVLAQTRAAGATPIPQTPANRDPLADLDSQAEVALERAIERLAALEQIMRHGDRRKGERRMATAEHHWHGRIVGQREAVEPDEPAESAA